MKYRGLLILVVLACASVAQTPASSQECRVGLNVNDFLTPEDAAAAKQVFETFRKALLAGDRQTVLMMVKFPADLVINGYGTNFVEPADLVKRYDAVFTKFVLDSVRKQRQDQLIADWDGVSVQNGAVVFAKGEDGVFRISDVRQERFPPRSGSIANFEKTRPTCPPVVVDGRVVAYDYFSHALPGFENRYADHLIVDVVDVVSGSMPQRRIRIDFLGVSNLPDYNLPEAVFQKGRVWRMYLRPADSPPSSSEVCSRIVQETVTFADRSSGETIKQSAIRVLADGETPTYRGLPCFETRKQYFTSITAQSSGSSK